MPSSHPPGYREASRVGEQHGIPARRRLPINAAMQCTDSAAMLGGTASQNRHTLCCCSHQPSAVTPRLLQSVLRGCQANHTMFKPVLETWFVKIQRNVLKYSGVRRPAFHTTACSSFCSSGRALCVLTAAKYQPNGGGCRCSPFNRNS